MRKPLPLKALTGGIDGIQLLALMTGEQPRKKEDKAMWDYDPKDASNAQPAGNYEATIEKVEETLSKKNDDPMLKITYSVYGSNGKFNLFDYITNPPKGSGRKGSLYKLREIALAVGLADDFRTGTLKPKQLVNKNLLLTLTEQFSADYGDQNKIEAYQKLDRSPTPKKVLEEEDEFVPF